MYKALAMVGVGVLAEGIRKVVPLLYDYFKASQKRPKEMPRNIDGMEPEKLREAAKHVLGIDTINDYNIAFCGLSGVGKSSLINALRGIHSSQHPLWAKVNHVTEGTQEITKYETPKSSDLVFWDVPGGATLSHSSRNYFVDKCLYAFDFLFIVSATRFTEIDFKIMQQAIKYNVPIAFVRTKIDQAIESKVNEKRGCDNDTSFDNLLTIVKGELKEEIAGALQKDLQSVNIGMKPPLFVVSANSLLYETCHEYFLDEASMVDYMWNEVKKGRQNG